MSWFKRHWIWLALFLVLVVARAGYHFLWKKADVPQYRTATIEKGRLVASVAATGTLQPVISVQVGSQVSGQLKEVLVDFNSLVKKNQMIARIDPESFEYRVRQAQADVDAARAQVATQQATILAQRAFQSQIEVSLIDARRDFERKEQLAEKKFISTAEVDKARATMNALVEQVKSAQAQVEVARANAGSAAAVVKQREAALAQARVDLERTAIRSPVDGIVIKRSVDKGQTVAASLQAPELFIIAENLTDLRVDTSIDESEVGKIQIGQKATFTVDAFPGRTFEGQVNQIRKSAQVVSNVVTYLVAISTQNSDLKLLPGMTANVRVVTSVHEDILKVPNSALRFRPPQKPEEKSDKGSERTKPGQKENQKESSTNGSGRSKRGEPGVVKLYRLEKNELKAMTVKTGSSDGQMTEITGDGVAEGVEVVTGLKGSDTGRGRPSGMGNAPRVF